MDFLAPTVHICNAIVISIGKAIPIDLLHWKAGSMHPECCHSNLFLHLVFRRRFNSLEIPQMKIGKAIKYNDIFF